MIKSQFSSNLISQIVIILIFSLGFAILGVFIGSKFMDNSKFSILFLGLIIIWLALWFITVVIGQVKTIKIIDNKIQIKKLFFFSKLTYEIKALKYSDYSWMTRGVKAFGFMIKLPNEKIVTIGVKEFVNSFEIIEYIKKRGSFDSSLSRSKWTKTNIIFTISGLIILICLIFSKFIE